jgi:putative hemolysin
MKSELRAGSLEVRLARNEEEIKASQVLRYKVFYEEMGASPKDAEMAAKKMDIDKFDPYCDHLLVFDHDLGDGPEGVVATYRLIQRHHAANAGQFYTADEFDISPLTNHQGNIMELGRSCVDSRYRTRSSMQLMWAGIAAYVREHNVDYMFGCGSFHGSDPQKMATELSYLHHFHLAPEDCRPRALDDLYVSMNMLDKESIDPRRALASLPPLVKGYLRLGGFIGEGAVIDFQFNTVDVCIIVKTELVTASYSKHFDRTAGAS